MTSTQSQPAAKTDSPEIAARRRMFAEVQADAAEYVNSTAVADAEFWAGTYQQVEMDTSEQIGWQAWAEAYGAPWHVAVIRLDPVQS